MIPSPEALREAVIAALPAAGEHWKADVRAGKHDATPLMAAASAGWAAAAVAIADSTADDGK